MLGSGRQSTRLSLIVCRSIVDTRVFNWAWISPSVWGRMFAAFVKRRAGARKPLPMKPASTAPMSVISSVGHGIRQSLSSRSWQSRLGCPQESCSIEDCRKRLGSFQTYGFFVTLPRVGQEPSSLRLKLRSQAALADQLGIPQQTLAHYEVARARIAASLLPRVAELLDLSFDELLMGQPTIRIPGKRGPASRLEQQLDAISQLPKARQKIVSEVLDAMLAQHAGQANGQEAIASCPSQPLIAALRMNNTGPASTPRPLAEPFSGSLRDRPAPAVIHC